MLVDGHPATVLSGTSKGRSRHPMNPIRASASAILMPPL
jgi:hypothetical protein